MLHDEVICPTHENSVLFAEILCEVYLLRWRLPKELLRYISSNYGDNHFAPCLISVTVTTTSPPVFNFGYGDVHIFLYVENLYN